MTKNTKVMTIRLPDDLKEIIKAKAKEDNISPAELVRRSVEYIANEEIKLSRSARVVAEK